jgi:hypothetical protein
MRVDFHSPRLRRRLLWSAALLATAGAAAAGVLLLAEAPKGVSPVAEPVSEEPSLAAPAQVAVRPKLTRLRAADRRQIVEVIDRFVQTAVERRDPAAAYDLATPGLRAGQTRADWARGDVPVFPFQARPTAYDDLRLKYVLRNEVGLDIVLPPARGSKQGPIAFSIDLKRVGKRWLVDAFIPVAMFAPLEKKAGVTALPDYAPAERPMSAVTSGVRLSARWLALPLGLLGTLLLVPLVLLPRSWWRARKAYRARAGA